MFVLNCSFGNNNYFKLQLDHSIFYGDLYNYFAHLLNINKIDILYIIYNNIIIDNNIMNPYSFNNRINIYTKSADVIIVIKNPNLVQNNLNKIQDEYLNWYNSTIYVNEYGFGESLEQIPITITEEFYNDNIAKANINYINEDDKDIECICGFKLSETSVQEDNLIAHLPCNHLFHNSCIKKHLTQISVKCPDCNYDIRELET